MCRCQAHHSGACGASRRDAGDRIFKNNAIPRRGGQFVRGELIDLGIGLRPLDHVAVHDHAKIRPELRLFKNKFRIGRFGVCGETDGSCPVSFEKGPDARNEAPVETTAHDLPVQGFLGCAVLEHFLGAKVSAEEIPDNLVVSPAEHPRCHCPVQPDAKPFKILPPHLFVDWIRIDDHPVQIEYQRQSGSDTITHIHRNRMIAQISPIWVTL